VKEEVWREELKKSSWLALDVLSTVQSSKVVIISFFPMCLHNVRSSAEDSGGLANEGPALAAPC